MMNNELGENNSLVNFVGEQANTVATEQSPLLSNIPHTSETRSNTTPDLQNKVFHNGKIFTLIAFVAFFAINIWHFWKEGISLGQEAILLGPPQLTKLIIEDSFITFDIKIPIQLDYDLISGFYNRFWIKKLQVFKQVEIYNMNLISVSSFLDQKDVLQYDLVTINLNKQSPFGLSLYQNNVSEIFIENAKLYINSTDLGNFLSNSLSEDNRRINFKVEIDSLEIKKGLFLGKFDNLILFKSIIFDMSKFKNFLQAKLLIDDLKLQLSSDDDYEYALQFNLLVPSLSVLPLFDMSYTTYWTIKVLNCDDKEIKLFDLEINPFEVDPQSEYDISIQASIFLPIVDHSLLIECPSTEITPINKIIKDLLNDTQPINLYVTGSENQYDSPLPAYIEEFVTHLNIPIDFNLSMVTSPYTEGNSVLKDVSINSMFVDVNEDQELLISTDFDLFFNLPRLVYNLTDMDIAELKGDVTLLLDDHDDDVASVILNTWQYSNFDPQSLCLNLNLQNTVFDIHNASLLSILIRAVLEHDHDNRTVDFKISADLDALVESELMTTTLYSLYTNDLSVHLETDYSLVDILNNVTARLDNMVLVSSSEVHIQLFTDVQVMNPLDFDLSSNMPVNFDLWYNETELGNIEMLPFVSSAKHFSNMTAVLKIDTKTNQAKAQLEDLMGRFISGNLPFITLEGHSNSIPSCPKFSQALSDISLQISLPQIEPPVSTGHEDGNFCNTESSAFLIKTTIHVMLSQIELTVFNPISNQEIFVEILEAKASTGDKPLAYIGKEEKLILPPGIHKTPKIPITYASGVGGDVLRKYIDGDLEVDASAILKVRVGELEMEILYHGTGLTADVRF